MALLDEINRGLMQANTPLMGLAQGLLTAGGVSTTPVSNAQALAQGLEGFRQARQGIMQEEQARRQQELQNQLMQIQLAKAQTSLQPTRTLSPDEAEQAGFTPGSVVQQAADGSLQVVQGGASPTPRIGRFQSKVIGNKLITFDSVTGQSVSEEFGSDAPIPPGLPPEMQEAWQTLSPKDQSELYKKQIIDLPKSIERNTQLKKAEDVKKKALDLITKIKSANKLGDVLGPLEGRVNFRLDDDEADIIANIGELENMLTVENLKLMSGVLSESDIKILRAVGAGGLDRTRSLKEFEERLGGMELDLETQLGTDAKDDIDQELEALKQELGL